jgi:bifunctional UDP-N-acetylglucosamine pyrophosphorylase/glucosamine-1-phosphate N-acetyltransferase
VRPSRPAAAVVLAAGEGTRMKSSTPKVLHAIGGRSLLGHALAAAASTDPEHLVVVVRHGRDAVAAHVGEVAPQAVVADQDDVPGTGRAVQCGLEVLAGVREGAGASGTVLVTYGDVPLLDGATLRDLVAAHEAGGHAVTVVTAVVEDPTGYGRVLRDEHGGVSGVVEHKDADDAQRAVREINSGIYAFDGAVLADALSRVGRDNAQGEMYLTDVLRLAREAGGSVAAHRVDDVWQTEGVNDRVQLARMGAELNRRLVEGWMREGVTVVDPATTWVDAGATLARDVTLLPGTQLLGATTVAAGATVGPDTTLRDCEVGEGASVVRSHAEGARIGAAATVGPFSFLRPGTVLGAKGKIGGFVETKNADIGDGAKVPHLTYAGDVTIGEGANIGAGTIFANYDGVAKHRTSVGRHSFVGSDSVLVAPVTVADGAYVGAGSTITHDVPAGAIAVARGQQRNVEGWVARRRAGTATAAAAQQATEQQATEQQDPHPHQHAQEEAQR